MTDTDEATTDEATTDEATTDEATTDEATTDEGETFPREYVERLRSESGQHRRDARAAADRAGDLEARVWTLLVERDGRLADSADLPLPDGGLEAADVDTAVTELLEAKPHLAARRPRGSIGQGEPSSDDGPSLAAILRAGA